MIYPDTSFLVAVYSPEADSVAAIKWLQNFAEPLPYTPFHRHEVRNAIRLRGFRGEITGEECKEALLEIESDLEDHILVHTPIPWTDAFREAENVGVLHTQTLGIRGFDLLHIGLALALGASGFLTFDPRQASVAKLAGLEIKP